MLRRGVRKRQRERYSPGTVSTFQDTLLGAPKNNTTPYLRSWGNYPSMCSHLAERKPSQPFPRWEVQGGLGQALWSDETPLESIPDLPSQLQSPLSLVSFPAVKVALSPLQSQVIASLLPEMEQFCSRLSLQLHTSAQKSPGRPWPFLSPCLVTFHCSELWPAHVGVRENWLCWAGTTSRPQLVPPGSPQFRVSAQLPSQPQVGPGMPWHSRMGHLSTRPPGHLCHGLWICVVPNHLDLPHPAEHCCVQGMNSPRHQTCPHFWVSQPAPCWCLAAPGSGRGIGSTTSFTCGQTQGSLQLRPLDHGFPARLECSGKR